MSFSSRDLASCLICHVQSEKKEDKKEEAVVAKEDSAPVLPETATVADTETAPVEAPATQVADTEAPVVTEAAPAAEEEKVAEPSSPKVKSPGVFDKYVFAICLKFSSDRFDQAQIFLR